MRIFTGGEYFFLRGIWYLEGIVYWLLGFVAVNEIKKSLFRLTQLEIVTSPINYDITQVGVGGNIFMNALWAHMLGPNTK